MTKRKMMIFVGADHRGFELKGKVLEFLKQQGYQPEDLGNVKYEEEDDYPDFALAVAKKVQASAAAGEARGILVCGSGTGMDIVANKISGVRSVLGFSTNQVFDTRQADDVNVLSLPADFIDESTALEMVKVFLKTPFSNELKYKRRVEKISQIEME